MSCLPEFLRVVQGEERTLPLRIERSNGASFSLTGVTEITARFKNTDGTVLSKTLTSGAIVVVDAPAGRYTVLLSEIETAALRAGDRQSFTVEFLFGTVLRRVNYTRALTVEPSAV